MKNILSELIYREPIFHRPELGITRQDFESMLVEGYWEIGASGACYDRDFCIDTVVKRYENPDYIKSDIWETKNFECRKIALNCYLLTYKLIQGKEKRVTRRATIWKKINGQWKAFFHQGTILDIAK